MAFSWSFSTNCQLEAVLIFLWITEAVFGADQWGIRSFGLPGKDEILSTGFPQACISRIFHF